MFNKPKTLRHESHEDNMADTEVDYLNHHVKTRPIKFEGVTGEDAVKGGLVIAILAMFKNRKSITSGLWGYFNSDFKQHLPAGVNKMIQQGSLAEIEKILVIDTENTWKRDLNSGDLYTLLKPLKDRIEVVETPLQRKREKKVDGEKIININTVDIDQQRQNFEAAVWAATDYGENCMIIIDSTSDYKDSITDEQFEALGKTMVTKFKGSQDDENTNPRQPFYQYRNRWWHNVLMQLRTSNGWVVETFKMNPVQEQYRYKPIKYKGKNGEYVEKIIELDEMYPVWCRRTEYRVDNGYFINDYVDDDGSINTYLRSEWQKKRHISAIPFTKIPKKERRYKERECLLPYPDFKRMAMMDILDDMSPCILGEEFAEEDLW